ARIDVVSAAWSIIGHEHQQHECAHEHNRCNDHKSGHCYRNDYPFVFHRLALTLLYWPAPTLPARPWSLLLSFHALQLGRRSGIDVLRAVRARWGRLIVIRAGACIWRRPTIVGTMRIGWEATICRRR